MGGWREISGIQKGEDKNSLRRGGRAKYGGLVGPTQKREASSNGKLLAELGKGNWEGNDKTQTFRYVVGNEK